MFLDYSKLEFDKDGIPEQPELVLETMHRKFIGVIPFAHNIKLNVKFAEPSKLTFDVPRYVDGEANWIYDFITGYKVIYTKHYGIYITLNPSTEADGISEVKHVEAYSIEKELDTKKFFLEEGTYKFYNLLNKNDPDTIIGRILEIARGWDIGGSVPTSIAQQYRTFDQYSDYLGNFIHNDAQQKFRCVFVFEPYNKKIFVYDADAPLPTLPIYLDFDNLLNSVKIEELSDELVTAIRPSGADGLSIASVNPIGTEWVYDLSWFIANGDIPEDVGNKYNAWQSSILSNQNEYQARVALRASGTARLIAAQAELTELNNELTKLTAQQNVEIQALAKEKKDTTGYTNRQNNISSYGRQIASKRSEISAKEAEIKTINGQIETYKNAVDDIVKRLSFDTYSGFTDSDREILRSYMIEQDVSEETFVASSLDIGNNIGMSFSGLSESISITDSSISRVTMTSPVSRTMYMLSGGSFKITGNQSVSGDIIRGTLEQESTGNFVLSFYAGTISSGTTTADSGMVTMTGKQSGLSSDIATVSDHEVITYEGSRLSFSASSGTLYVTFNINEYQEYSVQMELFDYAAKLLKEVSSPTYEFSVDSGNFIFEENFAPFREKLDLGKGVYLNLENGLRLIQYIIEFELDFEDRSKFSIVFSNRFKRHDNVATLKDMMERSYSTSRSIDTSKYLINQSINSESMVARFIQNGRDYARDFVIGTKDQGVQIDESGIRVSSTNHTSQTDQFELRMTNGMIAFTNNNWQNSNLAIGYFRANDGSFYSGVNAEVLAGNLIVGEELLIESSGFDGSNTEAKQFKFDSTGAWLNNTTLLFQNGDGKIMIDPTYGIAAGKSGLFAMDKDAMGRDTPVPSFTDKSGTVNFDNNDKVNFYLDLRTGAAYFKGTVYATDGIFRGIVKARDFQTSDGVSMLNNGKWQTKYIDGLDETFQNYNGEITNIKVNASGIETRVSNAEGSISTISHKANKIDWIVKGDSQSTFQMTDRAIKLIANGIDFSSEYVTFSSLESDDETTISGANIKTGTIDAEYVTIGTNDGGFAVAEGMDASGRRTWGAKMYGGDDEDGYQYVIVTNAGVRLQSGSNSVTVTDESISLNCKMYTCSLKLGANGIVVNNGTKEYNL